MKSLIIFWGIENNESDIINVRLERNGDDYCVYAYGDRVEINLYIGDDLDMNDLTYEEALRRRFGQISEDELDSEEDDSSNDDILAT